MRRNFYPLRSNVKIKKGKIYLKKIILHWKKKSQVKKMCIVIKMSINRGESINKKGLNVGIGGKIWSDEGKKTI